MKVLRFLKSYFLIILMIIAAVTVGVMVFSGRLVPEDAIGAVRGNKPVALAVLMGLFMLKGVAVCIPLVIPCAGAAMIFGAGTGLVINIIGTALCISESYIVGRYSKSLTFETMMEKYPKFAKYFCNASKFGFTTCFTVHCLQLSTEVQGVLFGLLRTKYLTYILSSMLALLPSLLCYTFIGDTMDFSNPVFLACTALLAAEIILGIYLTKRNIIDGGKTK